MRSLCAAAFPLFLAAAAAAANTAPVYDVCCEADVPYLGAERGELLDIYRPGNADPGERFPGVVIIHGGGWAGGTKRGAREINIGTNLARLGYVCVSIDYRLSRPDRPSWPENVHDCKRAVQFLRVSSERLQVNPERIGTIGGSAGGHLAAFLATAGPDAGLEPAAPYPGVSSAVQAAVNLYGIADPANWRNTAADGTPLDTLKHGSTTRMLGKSLAEAPDLWRLASPLHLADAGDPPIFSLHGKADATVDYTQSIVFSQRLAELGVTHELLLLDGVGHTFDFQRWGRRPIPAEVRARILSFFDRHLKGLDAAAAAARYQALLAWEAAHPESQNYVFPAVNPPAAGGQAE